MEVTFYRGLHEEGQKNEKPWERPFKAERAADTKALRCTDAGCV